MVRTIYVVFTNKKLSNSGLRGMKQYMFLCPYDRIQAGDMIEDNRYSTPMQVVSWNRCTAQVQNGITPKTNGSWEMGAGKTGYFIGKSSMGGSAVIAQVDLTHGIAIYEHKTVQYAGIVYFKNAEDAKEAAKMLGAEIGYLF